MPGGSDATWNLRGSIGIQQDMSVLQVFRVGACLKMFLKGVATLNGRDGGGIDRGRGGLGHVIDSGQCRLVVSESFCLL